MNHELLYGLVTLGVLAFGGLTHLVILLYVKINDRLRSLELDLKGVNTQMSPLWKRVEAEIAGELHHDDPRYAEMDGLLEDLLALRITGENRKRLKVLLLQRAVDPSVRLEEQKSARLMIAVMEKVLVEAATIADKITNVVIAFMLSGFSLHLVGALKAIGMRSH